jgi:hypothetical protein
MSSDAGSGPVEPPPAERPGRVKQAIEVVKFPPPTPERVLADRMSGAVYLAAWLLHLVHILLWSLVIFGVLTGRWWTVAASLTASIATWVTVGLIVNTHGRIGDDERSLPRRVLSRWWRGPWDPVGRQVWLPVLIPDAWRAIRGR